MLHILFIWKYTEVDTFWCDECDILDDETMSMLLDFKDRGILFITAHGPGIGHMKRPRGMGGSLGQ